jgi:hypothetical protein
VTASPKLPRRDRDVGEAWDLPQHAHVIVYETDDGNELLTIYDCGAAQKPPSAQVVGNLGKVRAPHELERTPTGYVVRMRGPAVLVRQEEDPDHYVIEEREE